MARRKSKRSNPRRGRVAPANARRSLPLYTSVPRSLSPLRLTEDRRLYHPLGVTRPARSFSQPRHRLRIADARSSLSLPPRMRSLSQAQSVAFQAPRRVLVCVRRSIRKEVIHALGKAGRVGQKTPRRSEYSTVSCRG